MVSRANAAVRRPARVHRVLLALATFGVGCPTVGCHPGEHAPPRADPPPPIAEPTAPMPYAGTWIGPALTLSFAGPWVLVRPTHVEPGQAPIELRATVERREGDAFALRTSVAGVLPADFLRPTDWTMLVEDGQLAIAMGDEPLTAYPRDADAAAPMLGPAMLDALELPEQVSITIAVACLDQASSRCAALEAGGPLAAGCRELVWATCVVERTPGSHPGLDFADPTVRAAWSQARKVDELALTLRYAEALDQAASASQRVHARAVYVRALERAATELDELTRDGPLADQDHPMLPDLLTALQAARDAALLD